MKRHNQKEIPTPNTEVGKTKSNINILDRIRRRIHSDMTKVYIDFGKRK